ncbi:band 4.1-like protein 3 isoform X1 [Syngnathus typhle]|uniref:band 4.1-like protein 3 isoform X1 n=1 Tax=Syngnathus typhle TaxID=161592 RepID=UPI002A6AC406|nr:band 4.1-like protein 3 isoform X1 [Syngnathus typhle]XP_061151557.1 band 4.1-like protein 3 isoform X1 [Syngnathus typhle]XP_061151558.1 band 4.1-like protein 3 isoform X1 [Syngnathus typhle]XP_061151559.1 band 4.1-like protein 3 isoform X1 [Syngnathus typhle]XP_061151560.1 band 4.1-like protein 3 isoform X1 [Syngnathus typhle]XP_061151561.1 band 4.1-like protein 3 isoform X1 [Syngnathus typhle]XP_061151562.1 band 4.1-like protein 3 isoform X1 [Syngnathus typhle]
MTTESGADSEARQQQQQQQEESVAAPKENPKAAEPASPQNQLEQFPAAVGHSTPARKEQDTPEEDQESRQSSTSRLSRSPLKGVKKVKIMQCKVTLLDGSDYTLNVEKRVKGQVLFDKVCDHLNLLEKDYFGITYRDVEKQKNWLDPTKDLKKQIRTGPWNFAFNVKFYPPDPSQLTEDITRYYLCLQLRGDVVSGRLPCSFATHTVLGSYTVQSELGDYDPEELGSDYISELRFAPNQTKELEEKVMELHKTYKGMTPAEAEMHFLENAKKLSMYGVDLHHAKLVGRLYQGLARAPGEDSEGVEIMLGVCASGLLIYRDRLRINRFAWPKILKISYKRNNFYIKIRPGEFEQFESTIGFKLPNHRAAKRLWKVCVEHHTFFRLVSPEAPPKKFLTLGSKFRYSGRTQAQTRRASSQIIRPAPFFERSASKRYNMSRSLDGAPIAENHETLMRDSDSAANARGDIITTVTTEKKAEEEKAEREDARADTTADAGTPTPVRQEAKRSVIRRVKGENVFVKHSNLMLEDTEPPAEMVKHQTNISELKRSFLETDAGVPGLTEWERRLSSSPARSPRSDEPPMIEPLEQEQQDEEDEKPAGDETKAEPQVTEAAEYLLKCPADSSLADGTPPQEISPSATMDDDVFAAEEKTPDSRDQLSEMSVDRLSPGSVREEVSQAITDKRGMLIILKEAEVEAEGKDDVGKLLLSKMEALVEDASPVKGSPKKAMASWVSEVARAEESEDFRVLTEEMPKTFEQSKPDVAQITHSEAAPLAVSTLGWISPSVTSEKASADLEQKKHVAMEMEAAPEDRTRMEVDAVCAKEMPVVHTETKTITYESAANDMNGDTDPGVLLSAQTITSETTSTTTTTHITKTVKGGISETRIEKRIVITGDSEIDHDEALAQAIKEAKEQHPDMSVTKVVVHKETEITPEEGED